MGTEENNRNCPDCGVKPSEEHHDQCDVAQCPNCGGQFISCECAFTAPPLPWTGEWPGLMECREFGWYTKMAPGEGRIPCSKDDPNACEDINKLYRDAVWSKEQGRFVLPSKR